jgi:hypothetical protein
MPEDKSPSKPALKPANSSGTLLAFENLERNTPQERDSLHSSIANAAKAAGKAQSPPAKK